MLSYSQPIDGKAIQLSHLRELRLHAGNTQKINCTIITPPPGASSAAEAYISARQKRKVFQALGINCIICRTDDPSFQKCSEEIRQGGTYFIVQRPLDAKSLGLPVGAPGDLEACTNKGMTITALAETVMRIVQPAVKVLQKNGREPKVGILGVNGFFGREISQILALEGAEIIGVDVGDDDVSLEGVGIIISAIGIRGVVKRKRLQGYKHLLVDVGFSYDEISGQGHGDFDSECYSHSRYYTPVPGGVGPLQSLTLVERALASCNIKGYQDWSLDSLSFVA